MIDEKILIEEMKRTFPDKLLNDKDWFWGKASFMDLFKELVEEQPKVGEWIPIGQYPSEPILLCFEDGSMAVGYYDESDCVCINMGGGYNYYTLEEPIAYMPLPPTYKGE